MYNHSIPMENKIESFDWIARIDEIPKSFLGLKEKGEEEIVTPVEIKT
jgi:hypothetical protein